jgi:3-oxoacyl-[acyl-carrier-protein] synthase-1
MAEDQVVVVGVGMMTPVGLTTKETAASVRSATMLFAETPIRDHRFEPFTLAEVIEDGLPELAKEVADTSGLTSREARMLRLATMPLRECLESLKPGAATLPGLILALPEAQTTIPLDAKRFLQLLAQQTGNAFNLKQSAATHLGRAGGLAAIGQAADTIRQGKARFMIAGGVDTYRDLYVLGTLDMEKRVKSSVHLDGFIPGEGAGFVLLASQEAARAAGLTALVRISPVAQAVETGHMYSKEPYRGDGLAMAVEKLAASGTAGAPIAEVYSSMNGESHWGKEWGVSFIRNKAAFLPDHEIQHPADCLGDTGAAAGPIMLGLAAHGIRNGYRRPPCLVYCSSDRGQRAALTAGAV